MTTAPDALAEPLSNDRLSQVREMVASGTVHIGGQLALQLLDELTDLRTRLAEAHEAIRDLLDCGIESDEPSLRYITVQIDRPSWKQAQDIIATKPKEQSFGDRRKGTVN